MFFKRVLETTSSIYDMGKDSMLNFNSEEFLKQIEMMKMLLKTYKHLNLEVEKNNHLINLLMSCNFSMNASELEKKMEVKQEEMSNIFKVEKINKNKNENTNQEVTEIFEEKELKAKLLNFNDK